MVTKTQEFWIEENPRNEFDLLAVGVVYFKWGSWQWKFSCPKEEAPWRDPFCPLREAVGGRISSAGGGHQHPSEVNRSQRQRG